jgi:hypothetical protein
MIECGRIVSALLSAVGPISSDSLGILVGDFGNHRRPNACGNTFEGSLAMRCFSSMRLFHCIADATEQFSRRVPVVKGFFVARPTEMSLLVFPAGKRHEISGAKSTVLNAKTPDLVRPRRKSPICPRRSKSLSCAACGCIVSAIENKS